MNTIVLFVLAITMDAQTGEVLKISAIGPAYESIEACSKAQQQTGIQKPKDGKITVYQCGVLPPGDQTT
jgi:hypothetical protein